MGGRARPCNSAPRGRFVLLAPGDRVSDARENQRWEATVELATGVAVAALVIAATVALAPFVGTETILGLPVRYFLAGLVVPVLLVFGVFWLARRQDKLDRRFDAAED
jgi:putative solute:sodium symporter small subunit